MTADVFAWTAILTHLSRNAVVCRGILGTEIITIGSGPFDKVELDRALRDCGVSVTGISQSWPARPHRRPRRLGRRMRRRIDPDP